MGLGTDKLEEMVFELYHNGGNKEDILTSLISTFISLTNTDKNEEDDLYSMALLNSATDMININQ